jgi:hypothetical protein
MTLRNLRDQDRSPILDSEPFPMNVEPERQPQHKVSVVDEVGKPEGDVSTERVSHLVELVLREQAIRGISDVEKHLLFCGPMFYSRCAAQPD